jgi:cyclopropane fatty-acyl-phospholipid synthase-like methyltransferase
VLAVDTRDLVERGYDTVALEYAKLESPEAPWPRMRQLELLLERLSPGSHLLDVGCGSGVPAAARIVQDHRVSGIDISARQIELARSNVPDGEFEKADMAEVSFPPATFDAIVAFYAIEHVRREQHATLLGRFGSWLKEGGYLLFTTESEEWADEVGDWLGAPMYFSQYDPDTTAQLLRTAGFELVSTDTERQLEGDREVEYVWFLAQWRAKAD